MCQLNNLIRIYVSDIYSYDQMPGYLTLIGMEGPPNVHAPFLSLLKRDN
jgi:hypothetical protein